MIRWVFLDVGNVLLDEDPLTYFVFRHHVTAIQAVRPDRSFADLLAEREARTASGSRWPVFEVSARYLQESRLAEVWAEADRSVRAAYAALSPPIAGAAKAIAALRRRFHLGLIANQPRECRDHLATLGWLDTFDVIALSEEEDLFKPDPALFRLALDRAGASPSECLMVGDRLDHDLAPASALGLATAHVLWPLRSAKGWQPDDPEARAYLASLERTAVLARQQNESVRPTISIAMIGDLPVALSALG
ncbi:MAG: HAD family hydrolase [Isosphaeraceae bacterium]|nr:HAD family hydrolase [Isosphaeraceae bacterium]